MIAKTKPDEFQPAFSVVSCFLERIDGKILLLLRLPHKSEGGKWGVPAGKVEEGESPEQAITREIAEETGITSSIAPNFFETYYVRFPDYDFIYHVFHKEVPNDTEIQIASGEHQEFSWVTPKDALAMELVRHQDDCTKFFYFSDLAANSFKN